MVGIFFVSCVIIWDYGMCIILYLSEMVGKSRLLCGLTVLDKHVVSLKGLGTVQIISFKNSIHNKLLRLLLFRRSSRRRLRIEPDHDKSKEAANNRPQASDPRPTTADLPASGIFIVGIVADSHLMLLFNVGEERPLVVDAEGEDAMLVWNREAGAIYSAVFGPAGWGQRESVEGGEHGELELHGVLRRDFEGDESVVAVL